LGLRIEFYSFFLFFFSIGLSWFYDPSHGLGRLTCSLPFFSWFLKKFHPSILCWLRIRLHNLFCFFYEVIPVSWLGLRVWSINLRIFCVLFLIDFLKNFYHSVLGWSKIEFYNLIWFAFYELYRFYDLGLTGWLGLTRLIFLFEVCLQFHHSIFGWLRIEFNKKKISIKLLGSHDLSRGFDRLTRVDPTRSNMLSC
jgi:hypothetical protein